MHEYLLRTTRLKRLEVEPALFLAMHVYRAASSRLDEVKCKWRPLAKI